MKMPADLLHIIQTTCYYCIVTISAAVCAGNHENYNGGRQKLEHL